MERESMGEHTLTPAIFICKMPIRDRLARITKQGSISIVNVGWQYGITKAMFTNNAQKQSK
jgi:hypothetical protein